MENTGFFIPTPVIEHFLADLADGHYNGFPQAGIRVTSLLNPAYRSMLKLPDDNTGVRVDGFLPGSTCDTVLKQDDVLLRIGSFPVASDGTILYQGNRLGAALGFQFSQDGESIPLELWRDGCRIKESLPMHVYTADRATGYQDDALPRYFVYGGMVFTPLSLDYLKALGRDSAGGDFFYELFYHAYEDPQTAPPERVVLSAVLADEVNANVGVRGRAMVEQINGFPIDSLKDVVHAFETGTNSYDVVQFLPHHNIECLDRQAVLKANPRIAQTYRLPSDRRL